MGVPQWQICSSNTTRNFSTKDKPGTPPLNVYEAATPKEKAVDFAALVRDQGQVSRDGDGRTERISHGKGTYVVYLLSSLSEVLSTM